jgi:hypothetical protein
VAAAGKPKPKATAATRSGGVTASKSKPKAKPKTATGGGKAAASRSRRNAAAPGQREQDVLRLVSERPGITVAQLAGELSVDATGLYGVVRRLQSKGQINKDGPALRPITETASAAATTPPEPTAAASATTPESPSEPPAAGS